jgi:hypothetical protein
MQLYRDLNLKQAYETYEEKNHKKLLKDIEEIPDSNIQRFCLFILMKIKEGRSITF